MSWFKGLRRRTAVLALAGLSAAAVLPTAHAKEGQLRIAQQFGIVYLLLNVAQDQQLIEKHGKAQGVDIKVDFLRLSGGAAINDALLTGEVDIAGAGVGPLFTIWDRTKGRQNVKGVASLGNFPYLLVSNNPDVKTIADFTDKDRIALPAVGVSVQSRILQMASAKLWGGCAVQQARQAAGRTATPGSCGGHHQGRHGNYGPLWQPAFPGSGVGWQPAGARSAQLL